MIKKGTNIMKYIFPVIFILYTGFISFFTHAHIINGVTIVHSHLYLSDDEGNLPHGHTVAEIQLIRNLNTFFQTCSIITAIILLLFTSCTRIRKTEKSIPQPPKIIVGIFRLRSPPLIVA